MHIAQFLVAVKVALYLPKWFQLINHYLKQKRLKRNMNSNNIESTTVQYIIENINFLQ